MREDTDDLIRQLCAKIGMIMEDMSLLALTAETLNEKTLQELQQASAGISALVAAAAALLA